jgi:hypothetical protein
MTVTLILVKRFLDEMEVWDSVLSWCNSKFFCCRSSWRNLMHTRWAFVGFTTKSSGKTCDSKGRRESAPHKAAWNFVHRIPRYTSTIIYRCIAILQLLNGWQHQFRKLWIPPSYPPRSPFNLTMKKEFMIA